MTLNGRNALLRKKSYHGAQQKNLNEDRPKLIGKMWFNDFSFRNIRYMRIIVGVPRGGGIKRQWDCRSA